MKRDSHTEAGSSSTLRLLPELGFVDLADPGLAERLVDTGDSQLEALASNMREGLLAAWVAIGLDVMGELTAAEVTKVAGPKGRHQPDRTAYGHGTESGKAALGGRQVPVSQPRLRSVGDDGAEIEVRLDSYDTFASIDLMADHMAAAVLAGLSGRRYREALEPVGDKIEADASRISQSAVSRRFIAATKPRLAESGPCPWTGNVG